MPSTQRASLANFFIVGIVKLLSRFSPGNNSAGIHLLGMGIRMAFILALARLTKAEAVGMYALAASIESVTIYLAGLELHSFTSRRYASAPSFRRLRLVAKCHQTMLYFTVPLSLAITLALAIWLRLSLDPWVLIGLMFVIAAGMVLQDANRLLLLTRRPVVAAGTAFIRTALWQPFALVALFYHPSQYRWIFLPWAIAAVVAAGSAVWLLRAVLHSHMHIRPSYLKAGLKNARAYYGIASLGILQNNVERFILQLMLGPAAVGVYSFFQTIANTVPSLVQAGLLNVMLPNILERFARGHADRICYLRLQLRRIVFICAGLGASLCIVAVPVTYLLGKPEYLRAIAILPVLVVANSLVSSTQPIHLALYAAHQDRILILLSVAALIGSLTLNLSLIPVMGIAGAVAAPLIMGILLALARRQAFSRYLEVN